MTKHPTIQSVSLVDIKKTYQATDFESALSLFISQFCNPQLTPAQVQQMAAKISILLHQKFSLYHNLKFVAHDPY